MCFNTNSPPIKLKKIPKTAAFGEIEGKLHPVYVFFITTHHYRLPLQKNHLFYWCVNLKNAKVQLGICSLNFAVQQICQEIRNCPIATAFEIKIPVYLIKYHFHSLPYFETY